jgi:hypothetical protein
MIPSPWALSAVSARSATSSCSMNDGLARRDSENVSSPVNANPRYPIPIFGGQIGGASEFTTSVGAPVPGLHCGAGDTEFQFSNRSTSAFTTA